MTEYFVSQMLGGQRVLCFCCQKVLGKCPLKIDPCFLNKFENIWSERLFYCFYALSKTLRNLDLYLSTPFTQLVLQTETFWDRS